MRFIDEFLNGITMYRLVLYCLSFLLGIAIFFGLFGILPYNPLFIILGTLFIITVAYISNSIFAKVYKVHVNVESVYISAFILALLVTPLRSITDTTFLQLAFWTTFWTIASKFIFTIHKKHIFNPVAFGLAITALTLNLSTTWWIGTSVMAPFVLITGLLIVRKTRQTWLVVSYLITTFVVIIGYHFTGVMSILTFSKKIIIDTPVLFFAFFMLTEPLTVPPTTFLRIWYGLLVGFLFAPFIHIGVIETTPEIALLLGNIFSYIISPKVKLLLKLKNKQKVADGIYDFIFETDRKFRFKPGQYLEWTLGHKNPDVRGNRRYFTIASSPTEKDLVLGVKFYESGSTYKQKLLSMDVDNTIVASGLSGEFILPKDPTKKLVFIAGGIGVTPFRSMIKYLIDTKEKRDIVLIYSNATTSGIAYRDILDEAQKEIGLKVIYVLTKESPVTATKNMYFGHISKEMIGEKIPDFLDRYFYVSGGHGMVTTVEETLKDLSVKNNHIKIDFFPGFV